jgi:hypothetical protein
MFSSLDNCFLRYGVVVMQIRRAGQLINITYLNIGANNRQCVSELVRKQHLSACTVLIFTLFLDMPQTHYIIVRLNETPPLPI